MRVTGMLLSRRFFLSLPGVVALFGWRPVAGRAAAATLAERPDGLVVVNGWVLRRDDLERLPQP